MVKQLSHDLLVGCQRGQMPFDYGLHGGVWNASAFHRPPIGGRHAILQDLGHRDRQSQHDAVHVGAKLGVLPAEHLLAASFVDLDFMARGSHEPGQMSAMLS